MRLSAEKTQELIRIVDCQLFEDSPCEFPMNSSDEIFKIGRGLQPILCRKNSVKLFFLLIEPLHLTKKNV